MLRLALAASAGALIASLAAHGAVRAHACEPDGAFAFVAIQGDPPYLVGTLPSVFTTDPRYFSRRFDCAAPGIAARRVSLGLYDVQVPDAGARLAIVSAISEEAVSTSVHPLGNGLYRVALRGPLAGSDVASRRDVPFALVVF